MKKLLCSVCLLALIACDGAVEGDVFIIKGSGEIAVSPGRTVTFIPVESEKALLNQASVVAGAAALESIKSDVIELCPTAKEDSETVLAMLASEIDEIKATGSVPAEGCGGLIATSNQLAASAKSTRDSQASELKRLNAELSAARSEKNKKVQQLADSLRQEQLDRLTLTYRADGDDAVWTWRNDSDYCVGPGPNSYSFSFTGIGFSNGLRTASVSEYSFTEVKDEFGFAISGCHLLPGNSNQESDYSGAPTTASPELKKALSEGKIEGYGCGYSFSPKTCIAVDRAEWNFSDKFLEVTRKDTGGRVEYDVQPVDWNAKARSTGNFAAYDKKIKSAEDAIARATKRHASNDVVARADAAKASAEQCEADVAVLAELEPSLERSQNLANAIDCFGSVNPTQLAGGLATLNAELQLDLEIPDVKKPYQEAFLTAFVETMSSESVITTDTSIQGHYSVEAIAPGNYLVMAEYADNFVEGFWLDAVTVESGDQVIDLNQNSCVSVPLIEYLRQASKACDECLGADPIPSRITLVTAAEEAIEARERAQKELQDALDSLERTLRRLGN